MSRPSLPRSSSVKNSGKNLKKMFPLQKKEPGNDQTGQSQQVIDATNKLKIGVRI